MTSTYQRCSSGPSEVIILDEGVADGSNPGQHTEGSLGDFTALQDDLVVITGKGLHSEDAPVLASEARGYLRTAFAPPLEIREVRGNAGRFVVPRAAIEAWVLAAPRGG